MHLGWPEILVILLFAFLIFGPSKLPEIGKSIGKLIGQFNGAKSKVDDALKREGLDADSLKQASSNPFSALDKLSVIADKVEEFEEKGDISGILSDDSKDEAVDGDSGSKQSVGSSSRRYGLKVSGSAYGASKPSQADSDGKGEE